MFRFKVKLHQDLDFKNLIIFLFSITFIWLTLTQPSFAENEDRTRLETEIVDPVTGVDSGHARFEERTDRKLLSVEIEDQEANATFEIKLDGVLVGPITTDSFGFADIELDSRNGDDVPLVKSGSKIEITSSDSLVLFGIFGGGTATTTPSSPTPPVSTTSVTIPFGAKDKTATEFFSPRVIQVNQMDTVTWTNKDDTAHTVTGSSFDSGLVSPGGTFLHKFSQNGTFDYACQLHPWMTGQVVVGTGGTTPVPLPIPPSPSPIPSPSIPPVTSQAKVSIPLGAADKKVTEYFVPKSLTVKANEITTWKNDDSAVHTVTSGSGTADGMFDSGLLGPEKLFSFAFTKQGTFDYFCQVHPWMTGQVTVSGVTTQSQTSPPSQSLPSPPVTPTTQNTILKKPPTTLKVSIPSGAANKEVTEYFVPNPVTIKTLDSVQWTNQDLASHTVTSGHVEKGGDGMFDSGLLSAGKSFEFEFKKAGTVDYFCVVHPWMTGQIIVKGDAVAKGKVKAPLKQIKSGTSPKDVECRSDLELVLKASDGSPACVKSDTRVKLVKRGWTSS